ncbi:MAG: hypothetical protein HFJ17_02260 [Clostridia bacterium]|nr:hypothetical protein [Clostridia bacterium]
MIETIFRIAVIFIIVAVSLAIVGSVSVSFGITFQYGSLLMSFLQIVCYILPFQKLMPVFIIVIALTVYKIAVALVDVLWRVINIKG